MWTSTGTAFGIRDMASFRQDVLTCYFKRECTARDVLACPVWCMWFGGSVSEALVAPLGDDTADRPQGDTDNAPNCVRLYYSAR